MDFEQYQQNPDDVLAVGAEADDDEGPQPTPADMERGAAWEQANRVAGFVGGMAVSGFGPGGAVCLYLPNPRRASRIVFRGGRAVKEITEPALADPHLLELRDRVVASFASAGAGWLSVDVCFYDYAAAVVRANYTATDADLEYLLTDGGRWQPKLAQHALGGEDAVAALCRYGRQLAAQTSGLAERAAEQLDDSPAGPAAPMPSVPAPSIWARARAAARKAVLTWKT